MRDIRVAKPYAQALFDAATEQQVVDQIVDDTNRLIELIDQSTEFDEFVRNPVFSPQFKSETFQQLLGDDAVHSLTLGFIQLLAAKQRERWLLPILQTFLNIVDEKAGRLVVHVTSAVALTAAQEEVLIRRLSGYTGKEVRLEQDVDAELKGGFILRLGDTVYDASVITQLQRMKELLASG
jgi:F-type H+-transporting ATPase subunit delta